MNPRPIVGPATPVVVAVLGAWLLTACVPPPAANGLPTASPTPTGTPSAPASAPAGTASQPPACAVGSQLVAVRATSGDTGFPIAVVWSDLGPPDDLFVTLSDVAPTIPLDSPGPASLTVGLGYSTGADNFLLTGGSVTLMYLVADGGVSGALATAYGKNSNRATPDPLGDPSQFNGTLTHPDGSGANGRLDGTITHPGRRNYHFVVETRDICASTHPTGATPEP